MTPMRIYCPDGEPFLSHLELDALLQQERQRADRLAERLRQLGIDPNEV